MEEYIDIESLCKWLNLKEGHARNLVYKGELPYKKIGHLIRFKVSEVEKWIEKRSEEALIRAKK